jgi:DNA polymerase-3 subunit epsilon
MDPAATPAPAATADDLRFAVVDVETSGLSTRRNRVLQVAVVTVAADGTVIDRWSSLIRPRNRWLFRLGPRHIHGLTRARLRNAPPAAEVMTELRRRLEGSTFTAHNADFDAEFLRQMAARLPVPLDLTPQLCTLRLSRKLDPERKLSHRLADVAERYGITNGRPHDALEDALATAAVLPHLLRAHGVSSRDQLSRLIDS